VVKKGERTRRMEKVKGLFRTRKLEEEKKRECSSGALGVWKEQQGKKVKIRLEIGKQHVSLSFRKENKGNSKRLQEAKTKTRLETLRERTGKGLPQCRENLTLT